MIGVLAVTMLGLKQLGQRQIETVEQMSEQAAQTWRPTDLGWQSDLWVPERHIDLAERIHQVLPTEGLGWALLQPAPHALSTWSGLKPLSELSGYERGGLGLPIEVKP